MRLLIISSITLLLGVWMAQVLREDTGYVLMGMGNWTIEMSFVLFSILGVISIFVGHYLIRTLSGVTHSPRKIKNWRQKSLENKASKSLSKGLLAQTEGEWHKAEKALLAKAEKSKDPVINYLEAAKAANAQGAKERAERYLRIAKSEAPKKDISVELTRIELMISNRNTDDALKALLELKKSHPKNARVLTLLADSYKIRKDWNKLSELLPELEKKHALDLDSYLNLQRKTYLNLLDNAILSKDGNRLRQAWTLFPKKMQQDPTLIYRYCSALIAVGESSMTENLLRQAIDQNWDQRLVLLYGQVLGINHHKQLEQAERWLRGHKDDEVLLLTLGRISAHKQLWGKARSYFEASLNIKPKPETYYALATLLEKINEKEKANDCYRKGLTLASQSQQYAAA